MNRTLSIILLSLTLFACAATNTIEARSANATGVNLQRESQFAGSAGAQTIYIDGRETGKLASGQSLYRNLTPGVHSIGVWEYGKELLHPMKGRIVSRSFYFAKGHVQDVRISLNYSGDIQDYEIIINLV